uniref:RxLR effector protein n=1 Tax=Chromera velia CCMP2878 TaxID=1169474 RepID=A0A0G4HAY1_9ALVE|eukprot:Cvel_25700.t1-p1 / transcript=Cvel_25700.t1 / gene=Cvel_25700 / organism=Chromera_velia_CCMP2878 / gene_product=hypothetical protein / transcript_product=hypothetical protein / location=Cvel_scaffold2949:452-709(-) / protein_length=86 / sequence_SO=supercontig / SO=protein_coding / is_pseudo=false
MFRLFVLVVLSLCLAWVHATKNPGKLNYLANRRNGDNTASRTKKVQLGELDEDFEEEEEAEEGKKPAPATLGYLKQRGLQKTNRAP